MGKKYFVLFCFFFLFPTSAEASDPLYLLPFSLSTHTAESLSLNCELAHLNCLISHLTIVAAVLSERCAGLVIACHAGFVLSLTLLRPGRFCSCCGDSVVRFLGACRHYLWQLLVVSC